MLIQRCIDVPFRGQRVALVRLRRPDEHPWAIDDAFDALESWLAGADCSVVYRVWQRRRAPAAATYLGRGKAVQLRALCDLGRVKGIVLDGSPTRAQRKNLEALLDRPVADRSVWAPFGNADLAVVRARALHRHARRAMGAYNVVLVGSTGAGKSTLFGALTRAARPSPSWPVPPSGGRPPVVTRRLRGEGGGRTILVTDTPGLVRHPEDGTWSIPPETQEECRDADAVLHVIDASHPEAARRASQVERLLNGETALAPARVIPVWTQADRIPGRGPDNGAIWVVSGRTGAGCDGVITHLCGSAARS